MGVTHLVNQPWRVVLAEAPWMENINSYCNRRHHYWVDLRTTRGCTISQGLARTLASPSSKRGCDRDLLCNSGSSNQGSVIT